MTCCGGGNSTNAMCNLLGNNMLPFNDHPLAANSNTYSKQKASNNKLGAYLAANSNTYSKLKASNNILKVWEHR